MKICICDISALEAYRSYGRLIPDILERPRTSKLDTHGLPSNQMLADDMAKLGVKHGPYHLAFAAPNQPGPRDDIRRHTYAMPLPRRAVIRVDKSTLISAPELLFVELAARRDLDEVDLALIGYELCGTYVLDPDEGSWSGLTDGITPLTTKRKLLRMAESLGSRPGASRARAALKLFEDGSNSPMETVLALILHLPRRLGGLGLGPLDMNRRVTTPTGDRWVDLYFASQKAGVEYKGKKPHSVEKTARDDRRQNKLAGSGVTIINAWYEDLTQDHLFDQLLHDIARALGVRLRIRARGFATKQRSLRVRLLPAVQRFGDFVA